MNSLDKLFSDLKYEADALNEVSDELSKTIAQFEDRLNSLKLGVCAAVVLYDGDDRGERTYLCYQRFNGKWQLVVEDFNYLTEEVTDSRRLADAPRRERVDSLDKFEGLLAAVLEESRNMLKLVKDRCGA